MGLIGLYSEILAGFLFLGIKATKEEIIPLSKLQFLKNSVTIKKISLLSKCRVFL
jgi:hypothetical protein